MKKQKVRKMALYNSLCETAYCVQKKDLAAASRLMAAAFADDASIRYLLGGKRMGSNDWKYFYCVLKAVYGKCVILSTNEKVRNLLILFPPQLKAVPTVPFLRNGGIGLCRLFGTSLFRRSLNYENNCQRVKSHYVTPDTWYCMCFAVSPEMQGQGNGSRLIRPVLTVLDRHQIPLYLETHKNENVSMYTHLGFTTVGTSAIPGTAIEQYAMLKNPRSPDKKSVIARSIVSWQ